MLNTTENSNKNKVLLQITESVSPADLKYALDLVNNESLALYNIESDGVLKGEILDYKLGTQKRPSVQLFENGNFYIMSDIQSENKYGLALLLKLLYLLSTKKKKSLIKKLLANAPEWILQEFTPTLAISKDGFEIIPGLVVKELKQLQAYWTLCDMAISTKHKIPPQIIAQHVLMSYGYSSWKIQVAAMETMIRRINSSLNEQLVIANYPVNRQVLGTYQVRQKSGEKRPYEVALFSNAGLDGSCTCKDFQKNTLRFCKHLSCVLLHWHKNDSLSKKFLNAKLQTPISLRWYPPLGLENRFNPLEGIKLMNSNPKFINLFNRSGFLKCLNGSVNTRYKELSSLQKAIDQASKNLFIDPIIKPIINQELQTLNWPMEFNTKRSKLLSCFSKLHINLYPYQKDAVEKALSCGKFLLADDMGLGKTTQAIAWAEALLQTNTIKSLIVISPAPLKNQWHREWHLVSGRKINIVDGSFEDRKKIYFGRHPVIIMNYELLLRDLEIIQELSVDAIILDEAQRMKNYATQTAKRIKCLNPPFRLVLTGTPMENRIDELASLMDWVNDTAMGPSWRLASEISIGEGRERKGVRNLNVLREKISPYFIRRTRNQVLKDLPSRTDTPIILPITEEQKDIHDDYARKAARLLAIAQRRPLTPAEHIHLMSYLTQMRIVSNAHAQSNFKELWPILKDELKPMERLAYLASPKLLEFRSLIEGLISQDDVKIIIFSQWQNMLQLCNWSIRDILNDNGVEAVFFTGQQNLKKRTENIVRFHDDASVRLFFATDAGGVGLNLQKAANICINLELPWNPAVLEQRIGRIYRIGQELPIQVFNLITTDSIEERITQLISEKRAVFDTLFDGSADEVQFDKSQSFYGQIQSVINDLKITSPQEIASQDEDLDISFNEENEILAEEVAINEDINLNNIQEETKLLYSKTNNETANIVNQVEPKQDSFVSTNILQAFQQIKVERTESGGLKIEAEGDSAKVLANVFQNMANLFGNI